MAQENMRIALACMDQDILWVIDEIICGLYTVDKKTFETRCVIDSLNLFRHGSFKAQGLLKWRDDYIIIIPLELDKKWVIYNKITGQVEYKKIMKEKYQGRFIGTDEAAVQAYFCPVTKDDPIIIVDLEKFTCSQIIKIQNTDEKLALRGVCSKKYFLLPLRGKRDILCINYGSNMIQIFETDITEGIAEIDIYSGELWVLPVDGNRIYKINEDGKKIISVELTINHQNISASEFSAIIVQKNYVFLLPHQRCGIYVYDKMKKKMIKIAEETHSLPETFKTKQIRYWGYYIDDNKICFLPLQNKLLQVDLDKLIYEEKNIYYPEDWEENSGAFYCIWNHSIVSEEHMIEIDKYSQKAFFKYCENEANEKKENTTVTIYGENIWSRLESESKNI